MVLAATAVTGAAMRYENCVFINITPLAAATYKFIGTGFEGLEDALNPEISEKTYISDQSSTSRLTSYKAEWSFDADVIKDTGTAAEYIRNLGKNRSTGATCETDIIVFDLWELDDATGNVECKKYPITVAMDKTAGGAGGENLTMSGKFLGRGDPVSGYFDVDDDSFALTEDIS